MKEREMQVISMEKELNQKKNSVKAEIESIEHKKNQVIVVKNGETIILEKESKVDAFFAKVNGFADKYLTLLGGAAIKTIENHNDF